MKGNKKILSTRNKVYRFIWRIFYVLFFRFTPVSFFRWRVLVLKIFGAKISWSANVYPSARIWAPLNLEMGKNSCLAHNVDCYCVGKISLGTHTTVSQGAVLCAASRNYNDPSMPLLEAEIILDNKSWIASYAFVGLGVKVGEQAVIGARAVVVSDVPSFWIVAGNPARKISIREPLDG